ncbi:MAG TPA: hypothetical protein VD927_02890 [Chryseosolibacter sp.]|nr:hypothetical protein [Chryseosolibacter sp.]
MQHQSAILPLLRDALKRGRVLKVKITHESSPFVARVEEILERKEVVKFSFDELPRVSTQRTSYYLDEISNLEIAGFTFNNPLTSLKAFGLSLTKMLA